MRADAIPVRVLRSRATLLPEAVAALFGKGYTLRGTERVEVFARGRCVASAEVRAGSALRLVLDGLDREALGASAAAESGPLRLRGPKGVADAPPSEPVSPALVLPDGVRRAWGLPEAAVVALRLGNVVLAAVPVVKAAPGETVALVLDRAMLLAAGVGPDAHARWLPHLVLDAEPSPDVPGARRPVMPTRRVITENDVRQARLHGQKLRVSAGQVVTPAALSMGRELGIWEE